MSALGSIASLASLCLSAASLSATPRKALIEYISAIIGGYVAACQLISGQLS
jgi:hypothetical protein